MSDYALKNLMDAENLGPEDGPEVRFLRKHLESTELGVSYFRYPAGHTATSGHRHEEQEEAYIVVGGSGRIKLDDEILDLGKWDVVRVAPHVVRGFDAGPDGLELIAVGGKKPEDGDGVRVDDRWPG